MISSTDIIPDHGDNVIDMKGTTNDGQYYDYDDDDSNQLIVSTGSGSGSASGSNSCFTGSDNTPNLLDKNNSASDCFASHDSCSIGLLSDLSEHCKRQDTKTYEHSDNATHRLVLYYDSSSTISDSIASQPLLQDIRHRLTKNLQFIKEVQAVVGPYVNNGKISSRFTIEHCDVSHEGMKAGHCIH
jgi:hypothetical protein